MDRRLILAASIFLFFQIAWLFRDLGFWNLQSSASQTKGQVAKIETLENKVLRKESGGLSWSASEVEEPLKEYDSILTLAKSATGIRLDNGGLIDVGENTLIVIEPTPPNEDSIRLNLKRGSYRVIAKKKQKVRVNNKLIESTPDSAFEVKKSETGEVELTMLSGDAHFIAQDGAKQAVTNTQPIVLAEAVKPAEPLQPEPIENSQPLPEPEPERQAAAVEVKRAVRKIVKQVKKKRVLASKPPEPEEAPPEPPVKEAQIREKVLPPPAPLVFEKTRTRFTAGGGMAVLQSAQSNTDLASDLNYASSAPSGSLELYRRFGERWAANAKYSNHFVEVKAPTDATVTNGSTSWTKISVEAERRTSLLGIEPNILLGIQNHTVPAIEPASASANIKTVGFTNLSIGLGKVFNEDARLYFEAKTHFQYPIVKSYVESGLIADGYIAGYYRLKPKWSIGLSAEGQWHQYQTSDNGAGKNNSMLGAGELKIRFEY